MSGQPPAGPLPAPPLADESVNRRQLDLFIDGADALLIHEIVTGLISRNIGRTDTALRRLTREHPRHPDLMALSALVEVLTALGPTARNHEAVAERIELIEHRLLPTARRFFGSNADVVLRPVWQALATSAAGLPFDLANPRAHQAWLCQQYGGWTEVVAAVEKEPDWADRPLLSYWMGLAQHHLGAREVAIRLWLPLCWTHASLFEAHAPTLPNSTIRAGWVAFEQADTFEASLAHGAPRTPWFPGWLLLRHRGLSRLFHPDDVHDTGRPASVFRHLLALLSLEQRGLTDELVRQRRALRQLDEGFFRYYMAVVAERRASS